jgi:hypothetical protein
MVRQGTRGCACEWDGMPVRGGAASGAGLPLSRVCGTDRGGAAACMRAANGPFGGQTDPTLIGSRSSVRHVELDQGPPVADPARPPRRRYAARHPSRSTRPAEKFGARFGARLDRQVEETRIATRMRSEESNLDLRDQNPECPPRYWWPSRRQTVSWAFRVRRRGPRSPQLTSQSPWESGVPPTRPSQVWDPFGTRPSTEHGRRRTRKARRSGLSLR